jgi:hypothetical protein
MKNIILIYVTQGFEYFKLKNPYFEQDNLKDIDYILDCWDELTKVGSEYDKYMKDDDQDDWFVRNHNELSDAFYWDLSIKYFKDIFPEPEV